MSYFVMWYWTVNGLKQSEWSGHATYNDAIDKYESMKPGYDFVEVLDRNKSTPDGRPFPVKCHEK